MSLIIGLTGDVSGSSEYNLVYGVRHNYTNASPILERTGNMSLHKSLPIQSKMKRCVVRDDGTVNYYLHPNNSTLKEDGTAADLSGADGNVMVEIPDSYWYFHDDTVAKTYDIKCSLYPFPDCFLIPKRYVSAYWCTVNRNNNKAASVVNTTAAYRGCQNQSEWDGTYRSALGLPANNIGIPAVRTYTANIGPTWHCYDITTHQLIYWLYVVEYANLNWQDDYSSTLTAEGYHKEDSCRGVRWGRCWDRVWDRYNDRDTSCRPHRRSYRHRGRVLLVRNQRPHTDDLRLFSWWYRQLPASISREEDSQGRPIPGSRPERCRSADKDGCWERTQGSPRHAHWYLWRARRWAIFRKVLREGWYELRFLLTIPCADSQIGSRAGSRRRVIAKLIISENEVGTWRTSTCLVSFIFMRKIK